MTDHLYYRGTRIEVQLGDRVELSRLLRRPKRGTVCYMPGVSPPHPEMHGDGIEDWAIEFDDGTMLVWPYVPRELQPSKKIKFLSRAEPGYSGLLPDREIGLGKEGDRREDE